MRFFKYLTYFILITFSINAYSEQACSYRVTKSGNVHQSLSSACADIIANMSNYKPEYSCKVISSKIGIFNVSGAALGYYGTETCNGAVCPSAGMPIATYFANNSPIPTQTCKQNSDGTFCIANYKGSSSPDNPLVIGTNAGQQIILNSVSAIPSNSCTPIFSKTKCDSKDPYGGCYQPPDDSCNRLADGSIYCPPDAPQPDITNTCNGATYCKRPPQGCGKGYVSGSFNGQQICIKTNPSTDNPPSPNEGDSGNTGQGTGTGTTTGTSTTTTTTTNADGSTSTSTSTTTTNNTTVNNFKIDLSGVIAAVNAVSAQISIMKNELSTSISNLSSKFDITNSKIDSTNSKIDTTNSKLTDLNASSLKQEQLLKDIRDKTNSDQPASGATGDIDLTETNSLLTSLNEKVASISDSLSNIFSDEGKSEIEELGQESKDYRYLGAMNDANSALNTFANKMTFSSSTCISDLVIQVPIYGSITVPLSTYCDLLALTKILLHLAVLMLCSRMIDATVRAI